MLVARHSTSEVYLLVFTYKKPFAYADDFASDENWTETKVHIDDHINNMLINILFPNDVAAIIGSAFLKEIKNRVTKFDR